MAIKVNVVEVWGLVFEFVWRASSRRGGFIVGYWPVFSIRPPKHRVSRIFYCRLLLVINSFCSQDL